MSKNKFRSTSNSNSNSSSSSTSISSSTTATTTTTSSSRSGSRGNDSGSGSSSGSISGGTSSGSGGGGGGGGSSSSKTSGHRRRWCYWQQPNEDKLGKEYYCRVQQILKTKLHSKYSSTATNILAVPVLVYRFEMVSWFRKEIENIDQKMRKLITTEGIHHPKADVNWLCMKRQNDGHGLVKLESAYNADIVVLSEYIKQGKDRLIRLM